MRRVSWRNRVRRNAVHRMSVRRTVSYGSRPEHLPRSNLPLASRVLCPA